ncbi:hypothetical protein ACOMHN_036300 [Nucella lapillus]
MATGSAEVPLTQDGVDSRGEGEDKHLPQWMTLDKDSDTKTPVSTEISGKVPRWLSGNLYRNGSGVSQAKSPDG